jgi:paraquat-inducible protein B
VDILIRHNQASSDFSMPVIIAIDKKIAQAKSDELMRIGDQSNLNQVIRQGLRARLDSESLVTGVLYVAVDIVPDAPPPVFHQLTREYQEIPSIPSNLQQLMNGLAHLNLQALSEQLGGVLTRLDSILGQLDVPAINAGLTNLLGSANRLVATPDLTNSFAALGKALNQASLVLARLDSRVDPLADGITNTLRDAQKTLADVRVAVGNVSVLIGPDSAVSTDLRQALEEFASAARGVTELAEFLRRNPNTLLTGKKQPKE